MRDAKAGKAASEVERPTKALADLLRWQPTVEEVARAQQRATYEPAPDVRAALVECLRAAVNVECRGEYTDERFAAHLVDAILAHPRLDVRLKP
jgi:hypothetical protein